VPWLRAGDNAATHPMVMRVAGIMRAAKTKVPESDVAINEVFGFVMRCALQSAGHTTDYVIDEGTAFMLGGARTERLIQVAGEAGYLKAITKNGHPAYLLVQDLDFVHIRRKAEIEWERQQRADASNPALIVPVRLRDGDGCRYCARIVNWRDRRGGRGGTYDHRHPGAPATADTLVVACRSCNSGRRDRADAEDRYPLLPVPADPFYSDLTAAFLTEHGNRTRPTSMSDARPDNQPDTAPRPPGQGDTAPRSADHLERLADGSSSAGTGRDGSGRVGSGGARSSSSGSPPARRRKRSRRGKPPQQRNGGDR
jgi:hypothetical protein